MVADYAALPSYGGKRAACGVCSMLKALVEEIFACSSMGAAHQWAACHMAPVLKQSDCVSFNMPLLLQYTAGWTPLAMQVLTPSSSRSIR